MSQFSPEQLQELNSVITSRLDSVKSSVDTIKTMMERQERAQLEAKQEQQTKAQPSQEELTVRQRIEQLEARNKQLEEKDRQSNLSNLLSNGLKGHGINQNIDLALSHLREGLHYDKLTGQPYLTYDGIARPLDQALSMFAESKHGVFLRDPINIAGAGQKPNPNVPGAKVSNVAAPGTASEKLNKGITAKNFLNRDEMTQVIQNSLGSDLKM